jgi:hypothetical protein
LTDASRQRRDPDDARPRRFAGLRIGLAQRGLRLEPAFVREGECKGPGG